MDGGGGRHCESVSVGEGYRVRVSREIDILQRETSVGGPFQRESTFGSKGGEEGPFDSGGHEWVSG